MTRIVDPEGYEGSVLKSLVSFRGMTVLDVGCGEGRTTRTIAREAESVIGVDPDSDRIAVAREMGDGSGPCQVDYRCADVVTASFATGSFDAAIFTRSL